MTKQFTYSVLQYKHSLISGESLNVGILFSFPGENKIQLVTGNTQRVKIIYPSFDAAIYTIITKSIKNKLKQKDTVEDLFTKKKEYTFKEYINTILLPEDSSAIQFSEPFTAVNSFESSQKAVEELSKILLPEIETKKEEVRHNETYILKKYTDYIFSKNKHLEHRISRDKVIQTKGLKLSFELSWKNGIVHLVKPISFDLKEERDIQNKSVIFFGYLDLLNDYAKLNNHVFDLLIVKPQDRLLYRSYENALEILAQATAPKTLITEEKLKGYSDETVDTLQKKDL